jgi:tetratricopeptide (TPR) repeat protein
MMFQDPDESKRTWKQIGKELGVAHLLAGSVLTSGATLHVNVKLISVEDESVIWAEKFTKKIEDILSVQQSIATAVSEKLKIELSPHAQNRFQQQANVNTDAYFNYLKGQEALLRSSGSQAELDRAIAYFGKAISIDSTFAKAWAGLADANLELVFWHRTTDGLGLPNATRAALTALKLDENLPEAYAALGAVDLYSNNLKDAKTNLKRAIQINPSCAFAHERLAWVYMFSNNIDQSFSEMEKTIELDPLSTRYKGGYSNAFYNTHEFDRGMAKAKEFLKEHPKDNFLLWSYAYLAAGKGNYQEAIDSLDQRTIGKKTNWVYGYCHGQLGKQEAAQEVLDTLVARDSRGFVPDFMIAVAYTAVGDYTNAINRLETATGKGGESFFAWGLGRDPMFKPLRKDPRFREIVKRIELMYKE